MYPYPTSLWIISDKLIELSQSYLPVDLVQVLTLILITFTEYLGIHFSFTRF